MTIGRVATEREPILNLRKDLGTVGFRKEKDGGMTIWAEYPQTFMSLVHAAMQRGLPVDMLPQGKTDLYRIGAWRGRLQEYVRSPHVEPYYPCEGQKLKVFSGVRPTGRNAHAAPIFFDGILSTGKGEKE